MTNLAMAVVVRDGRVLVQERYRNAKGMVFEFPGGTVDQNESGEQAAIRELMEETGIGNVSVVSSHKYKNEFGGEIYFVILKQRENEEPKVVESYRKQVFHWFKPSEIPARRFYNADRQFIETELSKCTYQVSAVGR